jgi:hypothetical protein
MRRPRRSPLLDLSIQFVDLGRLDLLQRPGAKHRHDVTSQQFSIALKRPVANALLAPPRCPCRDPMLDPIGELDLGWGNVLAAVHRGSQPGQLFPRLRLRPVKRLGVTLAALAVAQPPRILAALIDPAVAVCAPFSHGHPPKHARSVF